MTANLTRRSFLTASALAMPMVRRAWAGCAAPSLRIRVARNFASFDPIEARGDDAIIAQNILAPLVRYKKRVSDDDQWQWQKHLAASIDAVDLRTYSFALRNENWADKTAITAEDVKFSFERTAGHANDPAFARNRDLWRKLDRVEIKDASSALIHLKDDDPDLILDTLPTVAGCIVNRAYVAALPQGKFALDPGRTSGRYRICELRTNDSVLLEKESLWHGDPVQIPAAEFVVIADDEAAQAAWKAGRIDVYQPRRDVLNQVQSMATIDSGRAVRTPTSRTVYLALASEAGPLQRPELRRAVQLGIDTRAVAEEAYGSAETSRATGLVPRGWSGWRKEPSYGFRFDEASRLALQARQPGQPLGIVPLPDPVLVRAAGAIAGQLAKMAIEARVAPPTPLPQASLMLRNGAVDIGVFSSPAVEFGPHNVFGRFFSQTPIAFYRSSQYDALYLESQTRSERGAVFERLNNILVEDGAVAPLFEDHTIWWIRNGVTPAFGPDGGIADLGDWARG